MSQELSITYGWLRQARLSIHLVVSLTTSKLAGGAVTELAGEMEAQA
jgi:hypothetical protein